MGSAYNSGTGNPAGVGYREEQIHTASGLRTAGLNAVIGTSLAGIQALRTFNDIDGAVLGAQAFSTWTSIKSAATWKGRLPFPMTPSINIVANTFGGGAGSYIIRFRAKGYDQFGASIVEITPFTTVVTSDSAFFAVFTLSKVFSFIEDIEIICPDILGEGEISVGWHAIPNETLANTATISVSLDGTPTNTSVQFKNNANWGLGTPLRIAPYGAGQPFAYPEVMAASAVLLYSSYGPTVIGSAALLVPFVDATTDGWVLGQNVSGWEGTPHKIGFSIENDPPVFALELGGSSQSSSQVPGTLAQLGADTIEFCFSIRSTVGTRRGSRATPVVFSG
jgi:hypothetical protein